MQLGPTPARIILNEVVGPNASQLRGTIEVAVDAGREAIERAALAHADVAKYVAGATPKKIIIVPGKIVNIVVAS
jgi:leucyl-tRNA synthetase